MLWKWLICWIRHRWFSTNESDSIRLIVEFDFYGILFMFNFLVFVVAAGIEVYRRNWDPPPLVDIWANAAVMACMTFRWHVMTTAGAHRCQRLKRANLIFFLSVNREKFEVYRCFWLLCTYWLHQSSFHLKWNFSAISTIFLGSRKSAAAE